MPLQGLAQFFWKHWVLEFTPEINRKVNTSWERQQPQDRFWEGQEEEEIPLPSQEAEKICKPIKERERSAEARRDTMQIKKETNLRNQIPALHAGPQEANILWHH